MEIHLALLFYSGLHAVSGELSSMEIEALKHNELPEKNVSGELSSMEII